MEWHQVQQLLDKYYEGNCTLKEEDILKARFLQDDVPDYLEADKQMFLALADYKNIPDSFRIQETIHQAIDTEEKKGRVLQFSTLTHWLVRIAAVFIIALGGYFVIQQQQNQAISKSSTQDTFDNPELAYLETKKALLYISERLNTGSEELQKLGKFSEGMENLSKLGEFDKAASLVKDKNK